MSTPAKARSNVPFDVFNQVTSYLNNKDLKSVRLVSSQLASIAAIHLYRSVSISYMQRDWLRLLYIARHQEYAAHVKELVFHEINFIDMSDAQEQEGQKIADLIRGHLSPAGRFNGGHAPPLQANSRPPPPYQALLDDWLAEADFMEILPFSSDDDHRMSQCANQIAAEYQESDLYGKSKDHGMMLLSALTEAFEALHSLTTLILKFSPGLGIHQDTRFSPPSLHTMHPYFPLTEASFRNLTFQESSRVGRDPGEPLILLLSVMADTGSNIDTLTLDCESNFLKQGGHISHFGIMRENRFRQLRKISLCISVNVLSLADNDAHAPHLRSCLEAATQLEHLELSFDSEVHTKQYPLHAFENILPIEGIFPNLHTLFLEELRFTPWEIVTFILQQASSLRNLKMCDCTLWGEDARWRDVFDYLSEPQTMHLDHLALGNLADAETRNALDEQRVLSRVPADLLLEYINNRGQNPYNDQWSACDRSIRTCRGNGPKWHKWPSCCARRVNGTYEIGDKDADGTLKEACDVGEEDFDDMSVWEMGEYEPEHDDVDGPEYRSDYDFDAEEDDDEDEAEEMEAEDEEINLDTIDLDTINLDS